MDSALLKLKEYGSSRAVTHVLLICPDPETGRGLSGLLKADLSHTQYFTRLLPERFLRGLRKVFL